MKPFLLSRVVLCLFSIFGVAAPAAAGTVTLAWEANQEPDLAGYVVHFGTSSGEYTSNVNVGRQTSFEFAEPGPGIRYYLAVSAYNTAGAQSVFSPEVSTTPAGTLTLTGITASAPAPQPIGATITFSATASGAVLAPQFKWFTSDGVTWTVRQDWSPNNLFAWTPTGANPDAAVSVWARTGTVDGPDNAGATASLSFPITAARSAVTVTSLTANKNAPQALGARIMFSAAASGAVAPEFKWWVFDGGSWTVVQEWSSSSRLTWEPTVASPNYQVIVRARDAINQAESDGASIAFPILAGRFPGGGR